MVRPMAQEERERRRSPRWTVELAVAFRHLGRPDESHEDVVRNLSEGGVFIETSVGLPLGTPLAIEVALEDPPGRDVVTVEGEVVRVEWQVGRTGSTEERTARGLAVAFVPGQERVVNRLLARARARAGETS